MDRLEREPRARFHDIRDELDHLRRQVHSLTVENTRLRALLPREVRKDRPGLTRREKIEQAREQGRPFAPYSPAPPGPPSRPCR